MTAVTLLDGGLGQELVHRAGDSPTPLWSTTVMLEHPGLVEAVHRDFLSAGATVIATNTYAIHRDRLAGLPQEDQFEELHALALEEARRAKAAHGSGRIGGSIGPLAASYRPELHPGRDEAVPLYSEVARLLAPACDLILCETVASVLHARTILEGARVAGLPVWIGLTVSDTDGAVLRSGEPVIEAVRVAQGEGAEAILINCSAPEAIPAALKDISGAGLPFGAYANAFERITEDFLKDKPTVDALSKRRDMTPDVYADHALRWVDMGATIVGGCCEVSPAHIATLASVLRDAGHEIV